MGTDLNMNRRWKARSLSKLTTPTFDIPLIKSPTAISRVSPAAAGASKKVETSGAPSNRMSCKQESAENFDRPRSIQILGLDSAFALYQRRREAGLGEGLQQADDEHGYSHEAKVRRRQ